ncbi:gluconokinase [Roseateles cellulosilyticus]|uniref:Gluconokinase n=1 Tax=Pelomonas cellulosilytica TaxID=2906762 RepID=A0ABS8XRS0_9BURK|nr:gluconokinase [Pelomonas sp. P8]MCE4554558.1 gluconokinase [Pelomonas sp. P8]
MTSFVPASIVFMGVAGCGKSSLGVAVARKLGRVWVEGDDFHSSHNRRKMAAGHPLDDGDRASWLAALGEQLRLHPGALVACSALKHSYREQLRSASPGLRFAFLDVSPEEATRRVSARGSHFFHASLIDSQFATLQSPVGEPGVLRLDATLPLEQLVNQVCDWLPANAAATLR